MKLDTIIVPPKGISDACIIWLHGLGANGHDFENVIPELGLPSNHRILFIFPHAPNKPVTLNAGFVMPAWYDIVALEASASEDEKGIRQSEKMLVSLIYDAINQGIPSERILLMGFSQGGALALHSALRFEKPLGGVGVLSGYLPLAHLLVNEVHEANKSLAIFMAHGANDPLVPIAMAQQTYKKLLSAGFAPIFHTYPMTHMVCLEELSDIGKWILQQLPILHVTY